jgi:hypothetical protein
MATDEEDEKLLAELKAAQAAKEAAKSIERAGKAIKPPSKNGKK